jgi:hypothetical protein
VHRATLGVGSLSGNWATAVEFELGQSHMPFGLRDAICSRRHRSKRQFELPIVAVSAEEREALLR